MKKILLPLILLLASCTENERAKQFGGTMTINLPENTTLVGATWKDNELWYIYRSRTNSETPKTTTMKEDSKFGLLEGKVLFVEK